MPKTFGTKVMYEGITFDSKLEHQVYVNLRKFWDKEEIKVHHAIDLDVHENFGSGYYSGLIKPKKWKVDFWIEEYNLAIEAKGRWLPVDFWKLLALFKRFKKAYDRSFTLSTLVVVCANKPPRSWFYTDAEAYGDIFVPVKTFTNRICQARTKEQFFELMDVI